MKKNRAFVNLFLRGGRRKSPDQDPGSKKGIWVPVLNFFTFDDRIVCETACLALPVTLSSPSDFSIKAARHVAWPAHQVQAIPSRGSIK